MIVDMCWYREGQLHRDGAPAVVKKYPNIKIKAWYRNGKLHRDGKPAVIMKFKDEIKCEWYQDGQLHRENGPAYMQRKYYTGQHIPYYTKVSWHKNGVAHRSQGPTIIERLLGYRVVNEWVENGKYVADRPYRKVWEDDKLLEEIRRNETTEDPTFTSHQF